MERISFRRRISSLGNERDHLIKMMRGGQVARFPRSSRLSLIGMVSSPTSTERAISA
jgi:hypothetical protein